MTMTTLKTYTREVHFPEPLGWARIEATDEGVTDIHFITDLKRQPTNEAHKHLDAAEAALLRYVKKGDPGALPPMVIQTTNFRKLVYRELQRVKAGKTVSYGDLAEAVDHPGAARAVGGAMASNRHPVLIPCHRVLAGGEKLGGFTGGLDRKRALLKHEGARWKE